MRLRALAFTFVLAGCASNPQGLPVGVALCDAVPSVGGFAVHTSVQNKSDRPISVLAFNMSFYRDFRYSTFNASTHLSKELDPGEKRDISFDVPSSARISGDAIRCLVTHIGYLDGTSADLPAQQ